MKNCENMKEKNVNKEAGNLKNNQTQLKKPRTQLRRREKNVDNQVGKIRKNAALKVSAQN